MRTTGDVEGKTVQKPGTRRYLTPRQVRLAEAYLQLGGKFGEDGKLDGNVFEAARIAGYGELQAARKALLQPWVQAYIGRRQAEIQERSAITPERVLQQMRRLAFTSIDEVIEWDGDNLRLRPMNLIDPDAKAAIQSVRIKRTKKRAAGEEWDVEEWDVRLTDKPTVLKMLAEHLGILGASRQPMDEAWLEASRVLIMRLGDMTTRSQLVSFLQNRGLLPADTVDGTATTLSLTEAADPDDVDPESNPDGVVSGFSDLDESLT